MARNMKPGDRIGALVDESSAHSRPENSPFASKHKRGAGRKTSGFESVQDVIFNSMRETEQLRLTDHQPNIFLETFNDIQEVANGTFKTIKNNWNGEHSSKQRTSDKSMSSTEGKNGPPPDTNDTFVPLAANKDEESNMLDNLFSTLTMYGTTLHERLQDQRNVESSNLGVSLSSFLTGDLDNLASGVWRLAGNDNDENTVGTHDTIQEENYQIQRLGSWGTVNTCGTDGTTETGFNSCETTLTPREIDIAVADDDGNIIDPVLLQRAQKTREKRAPRRRKLVKFDYPPIKSLRQCPRPDPEDLPKLFFTEDELDEIENDRYSTMSTDDIEIVAVSSNHDEPEHSAVSKPSPKPRQGQKPTFLDSRTTEIDHDGPREQPDGGWKKPRERTSTPYRRRRADDDGADISKHEPKSVQSPSSSGRLVKGVQIFLRERSTGA